MNRYNTTRNLSYSGLMMALVFVATAIVPQVPIPFTKGYIHTGDSMIFVAAIMLGWRYGAVVAGLGSALADLFLGFSHWAIPTLIIKGIMGGIVGFVANDLKNPKHNKIKNILTYLLGVVWIVLAFYLKKLLNNKLGNVVNSDLAKSLISEFNLKNSQELLNLINHVENVLFSSIIVIPIVIIILAIILNKKDKEIFSVKTLMGMTLAGLWMVIGYYFAGGVLTGNMIVPIFSIPANILQFVGGGIIAFPIIIGLKRTKYYQSIKEKS
ncbi:ECF transporter S component [Thermohalobacter berrensis]|uniref:ECF transporter S component n=1 Tax=Thermohalobacter berrensis TaxID=99594 RepID=A0A419T4W4_9FIRM|nr:ECF transporter S component [Thermohalobacter berrensis]RKD32584.1 hypothetical protein BET03_10945 [Thermohalobacter berrensis]